MPSFETNVLNMIKRYEGPLLAINLLHQMCTCIKAGANEPSPACKYCFGTSKQIKVCLIRGVVQESNGMSTIRGSSGFSITKEVFIRNNFELKKDDLLVIENEIYQAYQIKTFRLKENKAVYSICYATQLKYNTTQIIENLKEIGAL